METGAKVTQVTSVHSKVTQCPKQLVPQFQLTQLDHFFQRAGFPAGACMPSLLHEGGGVSTHTQGQSPISAVTKQPVSNRVTKQADDVP